MAITTLHVRPAWLVMHGQGGFDMQFVRGNGSDAAQMVEEVCRRANKDGWRVHKISDVCALIETNAVLRSTVVVLTCRAHHPNVKQCMACAGLERCGLIERQRRMLDRQGIALKIIDERGEERWFGASTTQNYSRGGSARGPQFDEYDSRYDQRGPPPRPNPAPPPPQQPFSTFPGFHQQGGMSGAMPGVNGIPMFGVDWERARKMAGAAIMMGSAAIGMQAVTEMFQQAFGPPPPPPPPPTPTSVIAAMNLLGITDLSEATVRAAHKRHIVTSHTDRSGNDGMAARVNGARDLLLHFLKTGEAP